MSWQKMCRIDVGTETTENKVGEFCSVFSVFSDFRMRSSSVVLCLRVYFLPLLGQRDVSETEVVAEDPILSGLCLHPEASV